jgi:hypothetical protein
VRGVEFLTLSAIGWIFTLLCALGLAAGAWLVIGVHRLGEDARRHLAARVAEDIVLFGIWVLGLAGGIGVLLGKDWGRALLEFFCWVLPVLAALAAVSRFRAAPPPRTTLALSLALFLVPIVALCGATIVALRRTIA